MEKFPGMKQSLDKLNRQDKIIDQRIFRVTNMHRFASESPQERVDMRKRLFKEAHDFYKTSKTRYQREMNKHYQLLVSKDVGKSSSCPRIEDRSLTYVIKNMRMKALNRTLKVNMEKKRTTDWTLPRLVAAVREDRKHRAELDKKRKLERQRTLSLRQSLAGTNEMKALSSWLTSKISSMPPAMMPDTGAVSKRLNLLVFW